MRVHPKGRAREQWRWRVRPVLVALASCWLAACAPAAGPSSVATPAAEPARVVTPVATPARDTAPATAPVAAEPLKPIKIGVLNIGPAYLPHRIGLVQGFLRDAGFDAELQVLPANAMLAALVAGEIDFGDAGGSAIRAAASGLPVRMVACPGVRPAYFLVFAPDVKSARDLDGKAVAVNAIGSDTHVLARDLIQKLGGDPSGIQFAPLGTSSVRYGAVESGRVAAAIVTPTEVNLARGANLTIATTPADLPLVCSSGVIATQTAVAARPQEIRRFVQADLRAVQFMQADRAASARIMAEWAQLDEQEALAGYDGSQVNATFSVDKAAGQQAVEAALAFAKEAGEVGAGVQLSDVADLSFYP